MRELVLRPLPVTVAELEKLENRGLIRLFRPTELTLNVTPGLNESEPLYVSNESFGPHMLISVGVNARKARLGFHPDHEEFLIPPHGEEVKPLYLVISYLKESDILAKDADGDLEEDDFICLSMYPAERGAEMFTMLAGTVHCELTSEGEGEIGCFFVTEARDLPISWVDLNQSLIVKE